MLFQTYRSRSGSVAFCCYFFLLLPWNWYFQIYICNSVLDTACLRALTVSGCFPLLTDGRPLTLDEIWRSVHTCYQARLLEGPWDTITQQVRNCWPFTKLVNAIYAQVLSGSVPLLDTRGTYRNLSEVVLNRLPTIVFIDFEGYVNVHPVRPNVTMSLF